MLGAMRKRKKQLLWSRRQGNAGASAPGLATALASVATARGPLHGGPMPSAPCWRTRGEPRPPAAPGAPVPTRTSESRALTT